MLKIIALLLTLNRIEPAEVARTLGGKLGATTEVTPYRHETKLELAAASSATIVVGGKDNAWRIVEIVPKDKLVLADLAPTVRDLPHSVEPRSPHGPAGSTHHYRTAKLELVVDVDKDDHVERVILTTEQTVPTK